MRILLILHEYMDINTGAAGSTLNLGRQYEQLGHEVQYYSYDDLPRWISMKVKDLIFPECTAVRIFSSSAKDSFDVIDASTGDAWIWAKFLRRFQAIRPILVTRSHGLEHMEHLELMKDVEQGNVELSWKYSLYRGSIQLWEVATSLSCADLVFQLNSRDAEFAINHLGIDPDKTFVFPNGLPDEFLELPFEPIYLEEDASIRIAQVGTYHPRKGIYYSIPALNNILLRFPQVKASLIGTELNGFGEPDTVYADFAPTVRDRVAVIPYFEHRNLPELLKGHQIKLFPTLSEGFGKVLIEAMACGLAPITTSAPGPMDIVTEDQDAIVVPLRDSHAIEVALERLISDRQYLDKLRRNAYATAQKYSWREIAKDRLAAYEKAILARERRL
jgi:glycosyltransferase involved in cell wall biosynthesis